MLDDEGRIVIGSELLSKNQLIKASRKLNIFFEPNQKIILLEPEDVTNSEGMYFVRSVIMHPKGRIYIPTDIRKSFPKATFIPAERDGKIYILIIEPEKKPE